MTWDRISKGASCIISEDGLSVSSLNHLNSVRATEGVSDGKWYWEIRVNTAGAPLIGIIGSNASLLSSSLSNIDVRYYYTNGQKWNPKSEYGAPYTTGDLISVLLDLDLGTIEFMKNGVSQGVAFRDLKSMGEVFPAISDGGSAIGGSYTANFGDSNFVYKMPDGYSPYGKTKKMTIKNPTTDKLYSLSDNTLIHLPDNTTESIIEHGIEQGKFIQLDVPFDKHRYFNVTPVDGTSGKVFTHDIGKINTLSIKELVENKDFEPLYTWYETKMTSNTTPSPLVASASSSYSNDYLPFRAFDNSLSDLPNGGNNAWITSNGVVTGWIQLDFGASTSVNVFNLTPRQNVTANVGINSMPKKFNLLGSNDGSNYETIKSYNNEYWSNHTQGRQFVLDSTVKYRYYKLDILENNGGSLYVAIGEIAFGIKREVN